MFVILKSIQSTRSANAFLHLKTAFLNSSCRPRLYFKSSINHSWSNNTRSGLLKPNNFLTKNGKNGSSENQNFFTSYLLSFVRHNRGGKKPKLSAEELKNIKVNSSGIRRLISLAKPEKWKIAGINFFLNQKLKN